MISQSFIQDLLNRVDIVDVIERDVPLRKAGANYAACCPFHSEKTPSFTVTSTKQFYHCFGCGAHGNAIGFMMEYGGMNFVEAVNDLAARVGMQVPVQESGFRPEAPESGPRSRGAQDKPLETESSVQDLIKVMNVAAKFYREQLRHSNSAIGYLKKRGLTGKTAARFAIGYAPAGWQNLDQVFSDYAAKAPVNPLVEAGLVIESDDGKRYDRFRERLMFPI
ncbi:MAG: CHC2 zinc finger domain-containing protein, partial [Nitrosospira sp.]|nr:CHC2 zinc finger domain-containing protein [Nitrosospira sp.]